MVKERRKLWWKQRVASRAEVIWRPKKVRNEDKQLKRFCIDFTLLLLKGDYITTQKMIFVIINKNMKTLLLIALCVLLTVSLETFTITAADGNSYKPRIPFTASGSGVGTTTFTFTFPQTAGTAGTSPSTFDIEVFDSAPSQAFTKTGLAVDFTTPVTNNEWTTITASAAYDLQTRSTNALESLIIVDYTINDGNADIIIDTIDVLRTDVLRMVYVDRDASTLVTTHTQGTSHISAYSLTLADLTFTSTTALTTYTDSGNTRTYTLNQGYYVLRFSGTTAGSVTYQSDPFVCPTQIAGKIDVNNIFEPCHLVTYTDTLPFSGSAPNWKNTYPRFQLLGVGLREVLEITINFPNAIAADPQTYYFQMRDEAGNVLTPSPVEFGASGSEFAITTATYSFFWTAPYAGNFFLEVVPATYTDIAAVNVYYLLVTRANGGTLVQAVDALRMDTQILKYIKVSVASTISITHSIANTHISLYKATTTAYTVDTPGTVVTPDGTSTGTQNDYTIAGGDEGQYLIVFTHTQAATTLTYQSNTYNCPYDVTSSYTDIRKTFAPCTDPLRAAASGPAVPATPSITVYGDSLLHFTNQTDTQPRYSIGQVATNDRIYFVVNLLYPTGDTPSVFYLQLLEAPDATSAPTVLATQPANFGPAATYAIPLNLQKEYYIEWNVTAAQDTKYIYVDVLRPGTEDPKSFVAYELVAKKLSGSTFSTLAQGADILRNPATTDFLYNLIYLNDTSSTVELRSTLGVTNMLLFPMKSGSAFLTDFPTVLTGTPSSTTGAPADNVLTYSALPAGYYGVRFPFSTITGSASYQSRPYGCPVTEAYDTQSRGAFDPCTGTMVFAGPINLHQAYVIQAHGCGPTQFFNGTCNNVDPAKNCNTFNALSGDCTTCPNTKFTLASGSCVIPPTCSSGSTLVGVVCVSDLCATSNADGTCASCKSVLNEVKADGSCGLKVCTSTQVLNQTSGNCDAAPNNCQPGYFEVGTDCYKLGPNCTTLSPFLTCASCDPGFEVEMGGCVPCKGPNPAFPCAVCPGRSFVNAQGGCSPVSNQCAEFNPANGLCTACRSGDPVNGVCCPPGQTATASGCVNNGGQGTNAGAGGSQGVSFLSSAFFDFCGDIDRQKQVCNSCKPGYTFVAGNLCG